MTQLELNIVELAELLETSIVGDDVGTTRCCISFDSRDTMENVIFWPLAGERHDAHTFIESVVKKGALVTVVAKEWIKEHPNSVKTYIPVDSTNQALLKLAKGYAKRFPIPKIAITGSNGKTTTKDMLNAILSTSQCGIATEGNYNNQVGVPLTIFKLRKEHQYGIFEVGTSENGEIKVLSKTVAPQYAVITNIGASHLEFFKNEDNVYKEKIQIVEGLQKGGTLFVNADDSYFAKLKSTTQYKLVTFGIKHGQIKAKDITWDENSCASFKVGRTLYTLTVPGIHTVYNALAAIAVSKAMKIRQQDAAQALASYTASNLRTEMKQADGFKVFADCYNANPSSTTSALRSVGEMSVVGKKIAVLGDMLELGEVSEERHLKIGTLVPEQNIDQLITVGDAAKSIAIGARKSGMSLESVTHCKSLEEVTRLLKESVSEGDMVLVKASRGVKLDTVVDAVMKFELTKGL
ncbi:MAG: UDP-N-acetylmuramoyl-tripeptide--D-alanyl-D-alanine ligase [Fibrobacterales bacterium]